jgi:hypothetical protein
MKEVKFTHVLLGNIANEKIYDSMEKIALESEAEQNNTNKHFLNVLNQNELKTVFDDLELVFEKNLELPIRFGEMLPENVELVDIEGLKSAGFEVKKIGTIYLLEKTFNNTLIQKYPNDPNPIKRKIYSLSDIDFTIPVKFTKGGSFGFYAGHSSIIYVEPSKNTISTIAYGNRFETNCLDLKIEGETLIETLEIANYKAKVIGDIPSDREVKYQWSVINQGFADERIVSMGYSNKNELKVYALKPIKSPEKVVIRLKVDIMKGDSVEFSLERDLVITEVSKGSRNVE